MADNEDSSGYQPYVPEFSPVLMGADNHNIGNTTGGSWFDPSTWGDKFAGAGKMLAVSALSGADSMYNSVATVTNWFGADVQLHDTQSWITSIDDNLGAYYGQNKAAADTLGFIATSLVPGLGGIKVLNAGQSAIKAATQAGTIGANMARYTGILAPEASNFVKLAAAEIKQGQASYSLINGNSLKALGAGVWQNTLEGAAFETFVQATMFKSPILDSQDNWDIAKNILTGAALQGAIGGIFSGVKSYSAISKSRYAEDVRGHGTNSAPFLTDATSASDRLIATADNREAIGTAKITQIAPTDPIALKVWEAEQANDAARLAKLGRTADNGIRTNVHEMGYDTNTRRLNELGDSVQGITAQKATENFHGAIDITDPVSKRLSTKAQTAVDSGESLAERWIKVNGEDAGLVSATQPKIMDAVDRIVVKGNGENLAQVVKNEAKQFGFNPNALYDPMERALSKTGWRMAEARYVYVNEVMAKIPDKALVHENDIAMLQRALADKRLDIRITGAENGIREFKSESELKKFILDKKQDLSEELINRRVKTISRANTSDEVRNELLETMHPAIARTLDVTESWLSGVRETVNPEKGLFRNAELTEQIFKDKVARGLRSADAGAEPQYFIPKTARVVYRYDPEINPHVVDAMQGIMARQKISQNAADNVFALQTGEEINSRVKTLSLTEAMQTSSKGAGGGFLSNASGRYGSTESTVQQLGGVTKDLTFKLKTAVDDKIQAPLYHLLQDQPAAIEVSSIFKKLSNTSEQYVIDVENLAGTGSGNLVAKKIIAAKRATLESGEEAAAVTLQAGAPEYIAIENQAARDLINAHQGLTSKSTSAAKDRWAARGKLDQSFDPEVVRPVPPSPKDYQHFAFVTDPRVTGAGHTSMLFANSPKQLEELIAKVSRDFPEHRVLTKADTAEFKRATQQYDYQLGLNENYIDAGMKNRGIYSEFYPPTDPQKIVDRIQQYHYRQAESASVDLMRLKNSAFFSWMEDQAHQYGDVSSSKFVGNSIDKLESASANPYRSYTNTALNISSNNSSLWQSLNRTLDTQFSRALGHVEQLWSSVKSPQDLDKINGLLQHYGLNTAIKSSAEEALVNHTAPKNELSKFIRGANAIMSRFTLGMDPLNAVNNTVGANVLRMTELTHLLGGIKNGNSELAGALAGISEVTIPGTASAVLSPTKLVANSIRRFWGEGSDALIAEYKANGYIRDRLSQFKSVADDFQLKGTESVGDLNSRLQRALEKSRTLGDKIETATGNKLAEEFNRFISADVMRQLTDVAQAGGLMDAKTAQSYINTFVNRVEGNAIASQRPGVFQGPIGQAIGLFQSYQFNMMQNMFRYVADGGRKDAAMLLGLQGTLYGLQGEPGFKFLNDHIVGTLSGNQQHRDLYDITRGVAGKTGGDWLLYGVSSNILQTNLYSRGDINPRNATIIPTNLSDVPFVGGTAKLFGSLYETAQKIGGGGNVWESIRQGIEHNGISRPLAGLAQVSRGLTGNGVYSTSSNGNILGSNDLMSLASLSRLAGGKPLDEAIQNDTMFSINSYEAADRAKKKLLSETIKTTMAAGKLPDSDEYAAFASGYAALGGKQSGFAKHMMELYKDANTPQAQLIAKKLNNPLTYKIQQLMGGASGTSE